MYDVEGTCDDAVERRDVYDAEGRCDVYDVREERDSDVMTVD